MEGIFDALWLHKCGYNPLGMMGSIVSETQANKIAKLDEIYVMPDNDVVGHSSIFKIKNMLKDSVRIKMVYYPLEFKDPAEVPQKMIHKFIHNAENYSEIIVKNILEKFEKV